MRPDEDAIFERGAMVETGVVLDLAAVTDAHGKVDVDALADIATFPNMRVFADMGLPPYPRTCPDVRFGGYFRCWMNKVELWFVTHN